jgi:SAM-dependent methyltransferase
MLPDEDAAQAATQNAFGRQWALREAGRYEQDTLYGETAADELQSCLDRFEIRSPNELAGRRILDVGCGSGRLTRNLALWAPAATILGGDLTNSARIAHARCKDVANARVLQFDLLRPPFRPASFDYVYADGVLPHVPSPEAGLASLDRLVRPGGRLFCWIYPRRFSPYRLARDFLRRADRLPVAAQRAIETAAGAPLWAAFKLWEIGHPGRRRSYREVRFMLHDNLAPEFQHRREPQEMAAEFEKLGYVDVRALDPPTGIVGTKGASGATGASGAKS